MRDDGTRSNENEKEDGKKEVKREDKKNIRRPVTAQKYALKNDYDDVV